MVCRWYLNRQFPLLTMTIVGWFVGVYLHSSAPITANSMIMGLEGHPVIAHHPRSCSWSPSNSRALPCHPTVGAALGRDNCLGSCGIGESLAMTSPCRCCSWCCMSCLHCHSCYRLPSMSMPEQVPENEELSVEAGPAPMLVVPQYEYLRTRVIGCNMGTGVGGDGSYCHKCQNVAGGNFQQRLFR